MRPFGENTQFTGSASCGFSFGFGIRALGIGALGFVAAGGVRLLQRAAVDHLLQDPDGIDVVLVAEAFVRAVQEPVEVRALEHLHLHAVVGIRAAVRVGGEQAHDRWSHRDLLRAAARGQRAENHQGVSGSQVHGSVPVALVDGAETTNRRGGISSKSTSTVPNQRDPRDVSAPAPRRAYDRRTRPPSTQLRPEASRTPMNGHR
jgi:hypothetical protein